MWKGNVVRATFTEDILMSRFFAVVLTIVLTCSVQAAEAKPDADDALVTITVTYLQRGDGLVILELPPTLDVEVDGKYLDHMEVEKDRTRVILNGDSLEVYTDKEDNVVPAIVKIQDFQVGPGFIADPAWKIVIKRGWK